MYGCYREVTRVYEGIRKEAIQIVMVDMNAKCGRELKDIPSIGKERLHVYCNDNGLRLVSFATSNRMIIK